MFEAGTIWDSSKGGHIETFDYPTDGLDYEAPGCAELFEEQSTEQVIETEHAQPAAPPPTHSVDEIRAEYEKRLGEESRRAFEAGRAQGQQAEREAQAAALDEIKEKRRIEAGELVAGFAREHDRYLAAVEPEVVRLALQVAARILRREAQMDPLLLTGAVRVALGQLSGSTSVRLRIPAQDRELWQEAIALLPNLQLRPEVVADASMRLGDCVMETELGSVDLGIRAQMAEIERGFFDRAPGAQSGPRTGGASGGPTHEAVR